MTVPVFATVFFARFLSRFLESCPRCIPINLRGTLRCQSSAIEGIFACEFPISLAWVAAFRARQRRRRIKAGGTKRCLDESEFHDWFRFRLVAVGLNALWVASFARPEPSAIPDRMSAREPAQRRFVRRVDVDVVGVFAVEFGCSQAAHGGAANFAN